MAGENHTLGKRALADVRATATKRGWYDHCPGRCAIEKGSWPISRVLGLDSHSLGRFRMLHNCAFNPQESDLA
jgi:hypothetical protein